MFLLIPAHFLKLIMSQKAEPRVVLVHEWPALRTILTHDMTHSFIYGC